MASRSSWRGAIEMAGFPVCIELHNRIGTSRADSFRMLGTDEKPVKQVYVESGEYAKLQKDPQAKVATIGTNDTRKGVEIGPDSYKALTDEALEEIASAERSVRVEPRSFVPAASIPLDLSSKCFVVVPDSKVPGSEKDVNTLWNGLLANDLAYTTEITIRSGSRDTILALYAREDGLYAVGLPFERELNVTPTFTPTKDAKAADLFATLVQGQVKPAFEHSTFVSAWKQRRDKAVAAVLAGTKPEQPKAPERPQSRSDLMAALEAAVEAAPASKRRKPAAKKAPAKGRKKVAA